MALTSSGVNVESEKRDSSNDNGEDEEDISNSSLSFRVESTTINQTPLSYREQEPTPSLFSFFCCSLGHISSKISSLDSKLEFFIKSSHDFAMGSVPSSIITNLVKDAKETGILVITNKSMSEIPTQVFTLSISLRLLDLSANHLYTVPKNIGDFSNLKSLFLNQNQIRDLPEEIGCLKKLKSLSVSYNCLTSLPQSLNQLRNLQCLKASMNRLDSFPKQILDLENLHLVDLSLNLIKSLPDNLGLNKLQAVDLNLNENLLQKITGDLASSSRLKTLRLQNNHLTLNSIPEQLFSDSKITHLFLEGNDFEMKGLKNLDGYEYYERRHSKSQKKNSEEET